MYDVCMYVFVAFVTINVMTDLFILYLVLLTGFTGFRRYMPFQIYHRDLLFLKLYV